uniref:Uncharacterized protein n=1 Tax=Anguilla anguilla TaxID=7936 RepID=A0A0E9VPF0_ANGAN
MSVINFNQMFQSHDALPFWHWHLFGPHMERQQQQTANAPCSTNNYQFKTRIGQLEEETL